MIKLSENFSAQLDLTETFSSGFCLRWLVPLGRDQAIAIGWGRNRDDPLTINTYWFAQIGADGVSYRLLPRQMSEFVGELLQRPPNATHGGGDGMVAFRFGEGVGLLLASRFVYLYANVHAEPQIIEIENHFADYGSAPYSTWIRDTFFSPETCGHAVGNVVPVAFSEHDDRHALHACLLEIDSAAGRARWLGIDGDGGPLSLRSDEYPRSPNTSPRMRMVNNTFVPDYRPHIYDCAWTGDDLYFYLAGYHHFHTRFGASPAYLTRNAADLSLRELLFEPQEESLARTCSSQDRLIVTPLRKGGPRKGKQTIYRFEDRDEVALTLPRGAAKFAALDYAEGTYWLQKSPHDFREPPTIMACSANGTDGRQVPCQSASRHPS